MRGRTNSLSDLPRILWDRTESGPGWCRNWTGAKLASGYGVLTIAYKHMAVHRWIFHAFKGGIPDGMHVRHTCDNRACVNPDHLILGTNADNVADKVDRGRAAKKLNEQKVMEIKAMIADGHSQRYIASAVGISQTTVWGIASGRIWGQLQSASV